MLRRLLSAAAVLALLANPMVIWAQAGACMQLCLESCNKEMTAAHHHAANAPNLTPSATVSASQAHHSHCDGMQPATSRTADSTHAASTAAQAHQPGKICHTAMTEPTTQATHSQKPVAPCCQSTHNAHVMDAAVSPALLIGLLPENFVLAQLHAVRQRLALDSPTQPHSASSPPFEPPRS